PTHHQRTRLHAPVPQARGDPAAARGRGPARRPPRRPRPAPPRAGGPRARRRRRGGGGGAGGGRAGGAGGGGGGGRARAAQEGAMIALLVDRAQPGEAVERVPFLGEPAAFPVAPWQIAAVLRIPVMLAFGLYRGGNRYDLVFEPFSEGIDVPRRERAAAL